VASLLAPGHRRRSEALSILRPYVLADRAADVGADLQQPTERELNGLAARFAAGEPVQAVLPGLARLTFDESSSFVYELRITKSPAAVPVQLVGPADPRAARAGAILEYNVLDRFPFLMKDLAEQAGLNRYECQVVIYDGELKADPTMHRTIRIGSQSFDRYSHKALARVRSYVSEGRVDEAKEGYRTRRRG
jgi:hypothetical protein